MSFSPSRPDSVFGVTRAIMNRAVCIHVRHRGIGVITFIAYALPAMFDICPLQRCNLSKHAVSYSSPQVSRSNFVRVWPGLPGRPPCDGAALARALPGQGDNRAAQPL